MHAVNSVVALAEQVRTTCNYEHSTLSNSYTLHACNAHDYIYIVIQIINSRSVLLKLETQKSEY